MPYQNHNFRYDELGFNSNKKNDTIKRCDTFLPKVKNKPTLNQNHFIKSKKSPTFNPNTSPCLKGLYLNLSPFDCIEDRYNQINFSPDHLDDLYTPKLIDQFNSTMLCKSPLDYMDKVIEIRLPKIIVSDDNPFRSKMLAQEESSGSLHFRNIFPFSIKKNHPKYDIIFIRHIPRF
jgi:hypothetical protein